MREGVGGIEANIQLGHSTDTNFVFLRKNYEARSMTVPLQNCTTISTSPWQHTTPQDFSLLGFPVV